MRIKEIFCWSNKKKERKKGKKLTGLGTDY
jgi:hypothetical protein